MKLKDAAKWIREKLTGKKTGAQILASAVATQEEIERAKRLDAETARIAEMAKKTPEEVSNAILKVSTETGVTTEEATLQVHEKMELQAEAAAQTKEKTETPFAKRMAEMRGQTIEELEQELGKTAEQIEESIMEGGRIMVAGIRAFLEADRAAKIGLIRICTNNGRRMKGIPMVRRQQLLRAERNQRRRRSENRKKS